jgi:hypothetical protein
MNERTIRWPTLLGGSMDGQTAPWAQVQRGRVEIVYAPELAEEATSYVSGEIPEASALTFEQLLYVHHRPGFYVGERVVRVEVLAISSMTTDEVSWQLLCRGLGVPEPLR